MEKNYSEIATGFRLQFVCLLFYFVRIPSLLRTVCRKMYLYRTPGLRQTGISLY